jgi:predicted NBD/HSP70 family sugar kinase
MKKISTVVAKQSRNFPEQKLTIGLDLGDRWSWYCVLDEAGEVLLEQKLGTTPKAMKEVFRGMPRSRMALETGTLPEQCRCDAQGSVQGVGVLAR